MKKLVSILFILLYSTLSYCYSDTAIILIDMQEEFITNENTREARNLIEKQKELLEWGILNDLSLLVFEYDQAGETLRQLRRYIEMFEQYAYVTKYLDGGFHHFTLNRSNPVMLLRSWGISKLILTGVNGPYCVQKTGQGALNNYFKVFTSADLVANMSPGEEHFPDCSWWPIDENGFYGFKNLDELMYQF